MTHKGLQTHNVVEIPWDQTRFTRRRRNNPRRTHHFHGRTMRADIWWYQTHLARHTIAARTGLMPCDRSKGNLRNMPFYPLFLSLTDKAENGSLTTVFDSIS